MAFNETTTRLKRHYQACDSAENKIVSNRFSGFFIFVYFATCLWSEPPGSGGMVRKSGGLGDAAGDAQPRENVGERKRVENASSC